MNYRFFIKNIILGLILIFNFGCLAQVTNAESKVGKNIADKRLEDKTYYHKGNEIVELARFFVKLSVPFAFAWFLYLICQSSNKGFNHNVCDKIIL